MGLPVEDDYSAAASYVDLRKVSITTVFVIGHQYTSGVSMLCYRFVAIKG